MNTTQPESVPLSSISYDIPQDYRKRAEWFLEEFGETMKYHLENLLRFCGHLRKNQAISFSEITTDGYIHAHYGQYSLYFPIDKLTSKVTPIDWMNQYSLEIDNKIVPIDSGIQEVQNIANSTRLQKDTIQSRVMATLLPGNLLKNDIQKQGPTSQNAIIKRIIRIKPKNMTSV